MKGINVTRLLVFLFNFQAKKINKRRNKGKTKGKERKRNKGKENESIEKADL